MARGSSRRRPTEVEELRSRLAEAEQALEAIRTGQVESIVVDGPAGPRIFSLAGAAESYRLLVEEMSEGAATLDADGTVLYCNACFARLVGLPLHQVMGRSILEHVAERFQLTLGALFQQAQTSEARTELSLQSGTGEVPVYFSLTSMVEQSRRVYCLVATDLRQQKKSEALLAAEQAARESHDRLRQILVAASAGTWEWDIATGAVAWSLENYALYGVEPSRGPPTYEEWEACLHPDDVAAANEAIRDAVEGRSPEYRAEFRVLHPSLGERWILGVGQVRRSADGTALRLSGLNLDITARKRAELDQQRLEKVAREREQHYRTLFEASPSGIVVLDARGGILDFNERAHSQLGYTRAEFSTLALPDIEVAASPVDIDEHRSKVLRDGAALFETRYRTKTGELREVLVDVRAIDVGGERRLLAVWRDMTERKRAEEALRAADRNKSQFIATLSHELRNPLAPIRNSLYILDRVAPGGQQAMRAKTIIERQVDHMTRLVDDLLDVTRVSRGKIELHREGVELIEVVRRVVEDFRPAFDTAEVALELTDLPEPLHVDGDRIRLAQVVGNLLHNACKFTPRGGRTTVSLERDRAREQAVLRIRDDGLGIPPEVVPRLFQPFVQGDRSLDRARGGLGLGLSLVKGLVEMHGGSVSVHSDGPGRGAEFEVRLPSRTGALRVDGDERGGPVESRRLLVLIVEDNVDAAESLQAVLELQGHTVALAYNGPDGIARARALNPDVVLCDIGLPQMDGYEVARALRRDGGRITRLVALSGYGQPEDLSRAREAGFDAHVTKPPDLDVLNKVLAGED